MERFRRVRPYLALSVILTVAALIRLYGLAWDRGYLFHPDERQVVFVAQRLAWPATVPQFFSPDSPLNPRFFAYGSFPIYLLSAMRPLAPQGWVTVPTREDGFAALALVGRVLSVLFDLATVALTFLLGRRLYGEAVGLAAAAGVALAVLHIQLAHFYAVDTVLTCLVMLTMFFAARFADEGRKQDALGMGVALGLAMATKISAAPLILPIGVALIIGQKADKRIEENAGDDWRNGLRRNIRRVWRAVWTTRRTLLGVLGIALGVIIVTQPYALLDPIRYFGQVGTESLVARGWLDFPYTRQYSNRLPYLYSIIQSAVWGMGLPLGVVTWAGSGLFVWQSWRRPNGRSALILAWALVYFAIIGGQYAKYLRYMLPLLPFLFLMAAAALRQLLGEAAWLRRRARGVAAGLAALVLIPTGAYAFAFVSMYTQEHPWLQVSEWIYRNIPQGSTLATEYWDDTLPFPLEWSGGIGLPDEYRVRILPMYDVDDAKKLATLAESLAESDYVVLASERLYATIPRLAERYPMSTRYYQALFRGELGFDVVATAHRDPSLGGLVIRADTFSEAGLPAVSPPIPGQAGMPVWNWGHADESFTVYDHPTPLIFKKTRPLAAAELIRILASP